MLKDIKSPKHVKKLRMDDLKRLAEDVRARIIEVTAKHGGHVASSLGATDIAISLLKVFDPENDRIVWDVGHQSYAYKILTERNDKFDTIRQFGGLSGFNNIFESKYDAFGVGHSSTSISAALGMKVAKDQQNQKDNVVAVIGDGALTGGMAFEALNHAGHIQKNLIVILNSNDMSISKNVGALQKYLTDMLVSKSYNMMKEKVWNLSYNLPTKIRRRFISGAQKLEESLINILVPNIIFEDLGFKYVGPVDGHDITRMVRVLRKVKFNMVGPVLIHAVTQKGKGYKLAENDATKFHGMGPYVKKTGKSKKTKEASFSQIFGETLCELAEKDERITAVTAAMKDGTGLCDFSRKFKDRFFDVGIAEQHAVTFCAGMAISGLKPFAAIYSTFLQRALDQVIHDVALQKLPVVFCLDRGGLVGGDGATHHGVFDLSYLNFVPNLVIMAASTGAELKMMMKYAADYEKGPVAIRYPRGAVSKGIEHQELRTGKSEIYQQGEKIAILGIGKGFTIGLKLVEMIEENNDFSPFLVNVRFLKPFDKQMLNDIKDQVDTIVTIEDNAVIGGLGSTVSQLLKNDHTTAIETFGIPDKFIPHGKTEKLLDYIGLTPEKIFTKLLDKKLI